MAQQPKGHYRSPIVGDLNLPPADRGGPTGPESADPDVQVPMLVELNVLYPGGLRAVRDAFYHVWEPFQARSGGWRPDESTGPNSTQPPVPVGLALVAPKLYQCVLSRLAVREMVARDERLAEEAGKPPAIFRVWPDYVLEPQIDRSAPTVKADAAWRSYGARGSGVVWAVVDSGIDGRHPHFSALELSAQAQGQSSPSGRTTDLHRDFSFLVQLGNPPPQVPPVQPAGQGPESALIDECGHGTHVAGIIAGCVPDPAAAQVATSKEPSTGAGFVPRTHVGTLSGMAPACELVSLKVMRRSPIGTWVTSASAVIRALTYLRTEVNVDPAVLRVHGVNMSLGCEWQPEAYAAGQSPLCQALNQLVASGVMVVVSAGNSGARTTQGDAANTSAVLGSITEPAHAEECIAVGSTHRDAPHAFGVTWTSGKGPTLDGRMKPDVVAPGEWIASAAAGEVRTSAGLDPPPDSSPDVAEKLAMAYAEQSGTSMAAPHVSGVVAAFLSSRPEFIGRPRQVKRLLTDSATDLGREKYAQGAGLVDLMRMLSNV